MMNKILITLFGNVLLSTFLISQAYVKVGVADSDLNIDSETKDTVLVTLTTDHGETENVLLTESGVNTARFTALVPVTKSNESSEDNDGKLLLNKNTNLNVVYNDEKHGNSGTQSLQADLAIEVSTEEEIDAASGSGGCTSNPNGKSFDIMFVMMLGLSLLYPFRRRFIR